jgi:hypothetical protein
MKDNNFIPKSTSKYKNVKVWGQQKPSSGFGVFGIGKSFTVDKDKIQKIFAPNITIADKSSNIEINTKANLKTEKDNKDIFGNITNHSELNKRKIKLASIGGFKDNLNNFYINWWDSIKFDYYEKQWFRSFNYQVQSFQIIKNINIIILGFCTLSLVLFFVYLAFFDQYFTIKKYVINYTSGSYLNAQQTFELVNNFQKKKLYEIIPNNQYWFANNLNLTTSAKTIFPEIKSVKVKDRQWPNQINIEIETSKPLITLFVSENNEQKYWRINENGKISSQDKAALWYNLVKVEKPYTLQNSENSENLSLYSHSFENNPAQKQRFKLTKQLIDYFRSIDTQINSVNYPSISDTDINIETTGGTKFLFDSVLYDEDLQIQRLDYFLKSKVEKLDFYESERGGNYAYFDFRVQNKIYYCQIKDKCNIQPEDEQP